MKIFESFVRERVKNAKYSFTIQEVSPHPFKSRNAVLCGVYKLKKKGDVVSPAKGLYVIVPSESRAIGSMPPEDLLPILARHFKGMNYYAGLLTAADYHGASHQKPQIFQVITDRKKMKPIQVGKVNIEFIYKKSLENLPVKEITTKTGYLKVSTPEVTAMDLLLYPQHSSGLDHVATVLFELIEVIDIKKLLELIESAPEKFWIQRLGYILEHLEPDEVEKRNELIEAIYEKIKSHIIYPVPLMPGLPIKGASRKNRWKVIENTTIESDL